MATLRIHFMSGQRAKKERLLMRLVFEIAFSLLLASTLSNCALAGASKDKVVKSVPLDGAINLASISRDGQMLAGIDKSDLASGNYAIKIIQISDGRTVSMTEK